MPVNHRILLLDDDPEIVDTYRELLMRLPSSPEVRTATSGARALARLESEPYSLLVSDLNMPRMDGLQVLAIVRRRYPHLRIAVMTAMAEGQFRTRAYEMGVDLFMSKPSTSQEIEQFLDCIESLLEQKDHGGFRGVQTKSLMDLIQFEALSQNSCILKIQRGAKESRIWMQGGEIVDAEHLDMVGMEALLEIVAWKTGSFEILPAEAGRPRRILASTDALLLDLATALDETSSGSQAESDSGDEEFSQSISRLVEPNKGIDFILTISRDRVPATANSKNKASKDSPVDNVQFDSWGLENPEHVAEWIWNSMFAMEKLGSRLETGSLNEFEGTGPHQNLSLFAGSNAFLVVGFDRTQTRAEWSQTMKKIVAKWVS